MDGFEFELAATRSECPKCGSIDLREVSTDGHRTLICNSCYRQLHAILGPDEQDVPSFVEEFQRIAKEPKAE